MRARGRRAAAGVLLGILATACHAGPTDAEMRAMYAFALQIQCVAQDPKYEDSAMGRFTASAGRFPGWAAWRQEPYQRCLARKHPIATALCDDLIGLPHDGPRDRSVAAAVAVLDRHAGEVKSAERALELVASHPGANPDQFVCPSSLPDHVEAPR